MFSGYLISQFDAHEVNTMNTPDETKLATDNVATFKKTFVEPELREFDQLEKQIQGLRVLEAFTASFIAP